METQKLSLEEFASRIRSNVKVAENIHVNEKTNEIMFWIGDIFVELDPQLEEDGSLIYTPITLTYYGSNLRVLAKLYISSKTIILLEDDRKLTCEYSEYGEDPIMLVDEKELFDYLNELEKINDYHEFITFVEEEFKTFAGLD